MFEQKILKVSQVNGLVRTILEANFPCVLIEGEISNLALPNSGHIYFSLKDEFAQVRAVMFRNNQSSLKFKPQNGSHVVVTAQVSLYEQRGDYQLIVEKMELAGIGVLHAKFLQLKNKLALEGLFDPKYKKPLPRLPKTIGVITSPTGSVIRDILSVLKRRFPSVEVIVYPVQVQGSEAAGQVVAALQVANQRQECDLLILARGGGSLEDLWPFNEEIVARAIFASDILVVSAIGHETDFTIADFVADVRAPTPSAAAELVVPNFVEWCNSLKNLSRRLTNYMQHRFEQLELKLINLQQRLRHPRYYLSQQIQRLDEIERRLNLAMQHRLSFWRERLAKVTGGLDLVSPLATLARGYAVVSKAGKVIYKTTDTNVGDTVQAKLIDGELQCLVQKIVK